MPNNPFDRTTIGLRERPVSADLNRNWSQADRSLRATLHQLFNVRASAASAAGIASTGFIGDGFRCVPTSPIGMSVQLTAGLGFFYAPTDVPTDIGATDLEAVDDRSSYKPMLLTAPQQFAVPTAPGGGSSRVDIIEARYDRQLVDPQTRRQLDETSKAFGDHVFFKTLTFMLDGQTGTVNSPAASTAGLSYKVGAVGSPGLVPATTAGYVKIADIYVASGATTIDVPALADQRVMLCAGGTIEATVRFRLQWNSGSPTVTVLDTIAPPGVEILVRPTTPIGTAILSAIAGSITHAAMHIQAVDNAGTAKVMALVTPGLFSGGVAASGNAPSAGGFSRAATQSGAVAGIITGVIVPGAPATIDFSGGTAGLADLVCTATFHLMA